MATRNNTQAVDVEVVSDDEILALDYYQELQVKGDKFDEFVADLEIDSVINGGATEDTEIDALFDSEESEIDDLFNVTDDDVIDDLFKV